MINTAKSMGCMLFLSLKRKLFVAMYQSVIKTEYEYVCRRKLQKVVSGEDICRMSSSVLLPKGIIPCFMMVFERLKDVGNPS